MSAEMNLDPEKADNIFRMLNSIGERLYLHAEYQIPNLEGSSGENKVTLDGDKIIGDDEVVAFLFRELEKWELKNGYRKGLMEELLETSPEFKQLMERPIEVLLTGKKYISVRGYNSLKRESINNVWQLMSILNKPNAYNDILSLRNYGEISLGYTIEALIELGVPLGVFGESLIPTIASVADREEVKKLGYTDKEIDHFINKAR